MVQLKSYPARNGDAFLVKASVDPFAFLIDGGYSDTFHRYIKSDLEDLATNGYALDLVVATHIDADHISGLLSFFSLNGSAQEPAFIPVREVLHNSLRSLATLNGNKAAMRQDDKALLRDIRQQGFQQSKKANSQGQEISARQGNSLAQLLCEGGYQWNMHAGETPIGGNGIITLNFSQSKITILGPSETRLDALMKWWTSEVRRMGWVGSLNDLDDAFEFLCSREVVAPREQLLASSDADLSVVHVPDISVTNGSSISLIVEVEGRRLLFLGDSWANDTVAALATSGPSIYDAVKIAHHGSSRNTSPELLTLVDSPDFFISTNGSGHNHPDFAVLKAIVDRPANFCRTLHFNYSTPASQRLKSYQSAAGAEFVVSEGETGWIAINKSTPI